MDIARELTGEWFTPDVSKSLHLDLLFQDMLCYEDEGRILAFLMFTACDGAINISLMGARQGVRGKGYGSRLILRVIEYAAEWRFDRVELLTVPPEHKPQYAATLHFYLKHGFAVERTVLDLWQSGPALKLVRPVAQLSPGV